MNETGDVSSQSISQLASRADHLRLVCTNPNSVRRMLTQRSTLQPEIIKIPRGGTT